MDGQCKIYLLLLLKQQVLSTNNLKINTKKERKGEVPQKSNQKEENRKYKSENMKDKIKLKKKKMTLKNYTNAILGK